MSEKKLLSFWGLLSEYGIQIPVIQRDYAQGRLDFQAQEVREKIVEKIFEALTSTEGTKLTFDFVYGQETNGMFVPVDGQQRLTTLFLVHLYLLKRAGLCKKYATCPMACQTKTGLGKFTYDTRKSSREFCEAIVEREIIPPRENANTSPPSKKMEIADFVKDQSWFFADWAHDPTVSGMIRTLDEIHSQFGDIPRPLEPESMTEACRFLNKLISPNECPIGFYWLDMKSEKLDVDDLYLKMNARGLPLSPWEGFKAGLEKYLEKHLLEDKSYPDVEKSKYDKSWAEKTKKEKIAWKFDRDWLDFFWDKDKVNGEASMMLIFRRHFLNVWWLKAVDAKQEEKVSPLLEGKEGRDSFTPFDVYGKVLDGRIDECLVPIFRLFDVLSGLLTPKAIIDFRPGWWSDKDPEGFPLLEGKWILADNKKTETYKSRVLFAAVLKYFSNMKGFDQTKFDDWMRVAWNIVENTEIREENYNSALSLIDELAKGAEDILLFLQSGEVITSDLAKEQVKEERDKATLLFDPNTGKDWRKFIHQAEALPVFKGCIRNLLFACKNKNERDRLEIERFKVILNAVEKKCVNKGIADYLSVVTKDDFPIIISDTLNNTWREIFRKKQEPEESSRLYQFLREECPESEAKPHWIKEFSALNASPLKRTGAIRLYEHYGWDGKPDVFLFKGPNAQIITAILLSNEKEKGAVTILNKILDKEDPIDYNFPPRESEGKYSVPLKSKEYTIRFVANGVKISKTEANPPSEIPILYDDPTDARLFAERLEDGLRNAGLNVTTETQEATHE